MSTSMNYHYFRNLLPELRVLEDRLKNLLAESHETVSLYELKAAHSEDQQTRSHCARRTLSAS